MLKVAHYLELKLANSYSFFHFFLFAKRYIRVTCLPVLYMKHIV